VRVLLKPFDLENLVTAVRGMLTAQTLIDKVRERDLADNIMPGVFALSAVVAD